jgi:hypothetical protein
MGNTRKERQVPTHFGKTGTFSFFIVLLGGKTGTFLMEEQTRGQSQLVRMLSDIL